MIATLPILMALSWVPTSAVPAQATPARAQPQVDKSAQATGTITCPLNGQEIPSCCCPVKK